MGDAAKILWPRLHRPTVWFVEHSNTKVLGLDENLTAFFFWYHSIQSKRVCFQSGAYAKPDT